MGIWAYKVRRRYKKVKNRGRDNPAPVFYVFRCFYLFSHAVFIALVHIIVKIVFRILGKKITIIIMSMFTAI